MELQTEIPLKPESNQIDYNSKLLLLGSCFAENIGERIDYFKFQNTVNPFGILFHPKAIETVVINASVKKEYTEDSIFFHNEQWHCYDAHSKLSSSNKIELLARLNKSLEITRKCINDASHIIITLGTAWVYRLIENNAVVANCHKVSQNAFEKELLSPEVIVESLENIITAIKEVNKAVSIVFTVSPVRHIKDGFVENTRSKAHLISAVHEVINKESLKQSQTLTYFPSFEIMMDSLRDYRFYKKDMLHPNELAIDYIWDYFKKSWINETSFRIMEEVEWIQKGISHVSYNPNSEAHFKFLKNLEEKQKSLNRKIKHIQF